MSEYSATYNDKESGDSRKITVEYNLGDSLDEAVESFGGDVVFSNFKAHASVSIQARIRSLAKQGKTDKEIQEDFKAWKLGVASRVRKSPVEKIADAYEKMSPEEQAAFIEKLRAAKQA